MMMSWKVPPGRKANTAATYCPSRPSQLRTQTQKHTKIWRLLQPRSRVNKYKKKWTKIPQIGIIKDSAASDFEMAFYVVASFVLRSRWVRWLLGDVPARRSSAPQRRPAPRSSFAHMLLFSTCTWNCLQNSRNHVQVLFSDPVRGRLCK